MTQHVTISLDDQELERARASAASLGVPVEEYLRRLIAGHLPAPAGKARADVSIIIGIGETAEPTNVAQDKHGMIGEAVWSEHVQETGRQ